MKTNAEYLRDWRANNPEKVKEQGKRHRERHGQVLAMKNKAWRADNPERLAAYDEYARAKRKTEEAKARRLEYSRIYYQTPHGRAVALVHAARSRAEKKGLAFALSVEHVEAVISAGVCELTGLPFSLAGTTESWRDPWGPSLDRTDSNGGYTPDNVRVVVCIYNLAKSDFTSDDVLRFARALDNKADKP